MRKSIKHVHWPEAPNMWMPYAPAIKVKGGTTVYLAGVTAAPVYHHHPHRPEEFESMPHDMAGQTRAALENLKRGLSAVGATFADVVKADRFVTDLADQDALNRVWAEYFGDAKPATTTVQVVRLATDPRCLIEINAVAVTD
ncbi:MAG TPA: RidA family protein [Alphaproteobacteria bacterium]|nr:RidA family protein [Alphaproteobacteria bacterium]